MPRRQWSAGASGSLKTREGQYQVCVENITSHGWERLGLMSSESWRNDPKHLVFTLSRYKFVAKLLDGRERVLEVGCGDALGTRIVRQAVKSLTATDFDPMFIEDAAKRQSLPWTFDLVVHSFCEGPMPGTFDAIYALDVLEHIPVSEERGFLSTVLSSLDANGVAIIGMPSLESQPYASEQSRLGHVNCKSGPHLKSLMQDFFSNVFLFSMNDEVVHTGFHKMANYVIVLCCTKRSP